MWFFLFAKNKEDDEMSKNIANENGFYVAGWMIKELGLKGNALMIYAVIYGYSQNGKEDYHAGNKYLSEFLGIHPNSVSNTLADLVAKGLLTKEEETLNGWKLPSHYKAVR